MLHVKRVLSYHNDLQLEANEKKTYNEANLAV